MSLITHCRICDSTDLETIIDLGNQPWGNGFLKADQFATEISYPLVLVRCEKCSLAQLNYTIAKEDMFIKHTYLSGTTNTLNEHFSQLAKKTHASFLQNFSKPRVLDIGSNDGTQLKHYQELGCDVLGVESAPHAVEIAIANGIPTEEVFFNSESAREINLKFNLINASGVFFHLEELHSVCEGVKFALDSDGVFIVQFIYMKTMQDNVAFDQIYHEHLLYYTLTTLSILLEMHGLELFDSHLSSIHGGSMIAYVSHPGRYKKTSRLNSYLENEIKSHTNEKKRYEEFAIQSHQMKEKTLEWFEFMSEKDKLVYGLGAPVKGNTLINYFGLKKENLPYLIERNPLRQGLFSPGAHIPLLLEHEIVVSPDAYFVLAWNFKSEILQRHADDILQGIEFYFPIDPM
jgi:SAM-dependent methyltransferase